MGERNEVSAFIGCFGVARLRESAPAGLYDGPIAGAAAEIASERVVDGVVARRLAGAAQCFDGHDETRRAEAALRPVALHQCALRSAQRAVAAEAFDRQKRSARELRHQHQARIYRLPFERFAAQAA